MTVTVKNKAFVHMNAGMDTIMATYPILGVDFDNGSEFLNWGMIAWRDKHKIPTITRSRRYELNDNAHVEQRNGDWVRKHAFRYRYENRRRTCRPEPALDPGPHPDEQPPAMRQSRRLERDHLDMRQDGVPTLPYHSDSLH